MKPAFMKIIICILTAGLVLAGCGSSSSDTADVKNTKTEVTTTPEVTSEPVTVTPEPTEQAAATTPEPTQETTPEPTVAPETSENTSTSDSQVTPSFKEYLDSYEAFINEYCDFMEKYDANPTDAELLKEYADYMDKYTDFMKKINEYSDEEDEMTTADLNYYLDVTNRVNKRLVEVAGK